MRGYRRGSSELTCAYPALTLPVLVTSYYCSPFRSSYDENILEKAPTTVTKVEVQSPSVHPVQRSSPLRSVLSILAQSHGRAIDSYSWLDRRLRHPGQNTSCERQTLRLLRSVFHVVIPWATSGPLRQGEEPQTAGWHTQCGRNQTDARQHHQTASPQLLCQAGNLDTNGLEAIATDRSTLTFSRSGPRRGNAPGGCRHQTQCCELACDWCHQRPAADTEAKCRADGSPAR